MFCKNCGSQVPDGIAFCAACGTPVPGAAAPAAVAAPAAAVAAPKKSKNNMIVLIAIIAAVAVLAGAVILIFSGGGAEGVAVDYVEAYLEGDIEKMLDLTAGEAQAFFEESWEDEDVLFEVLELNCEDAEAEGVNNINDFKTAYDAYAKMQEAEDKEYYKEILTTKVDVRLTEAMSDKELKAICEIVDDDSCEDFINPDLITEGQFVVVKVYVDGEKESDAWDAVVPVVKYDGSWKVLIVDGTPFQSPYVDGTYSWYSDDEDSDAYKRAIYNKEYAENIKKDNDKYIAMLTVERGAAKAADEWSEYDEKEYIEETTTKQTIQSGNYEDYDY